MIQIQDSVLYNPNTKLILKYFQSSPACFTLSWWSTDNCGGFNKMALTIIIINYKMLHRHI